MFSEIEPFFFHIQTTQDPSSPVFSAKKASALECLYDISIQILENGQVLINLGRQHLGIF